MLESKWSKIQEEEWGFHITCGGQEDFSDLLMFEPDREKMKVSHQTVGERKNETERIAGAKAWDETVPRIFERQETKNWWL